MTTYHGRADIYSSQPQISLYNEVYTSIIQFMSGTLAQGMGIQMVESNRGVGGKGLDFWDTAGWSGKRTWAVFRFLSSSYGQFDLAIYCNSGSGADTNDPWQPGIEAQNAAGTGNFGSIGIAVACHPSGTTSLPWNGSSGSFVSGTAGSPVWKPAADGRLAVFPRENSNDGAFVSHRNYMLNLDGSTSSPNPPQRFHLIVSQDSFTFLWGSALDGQAYKINHFGPYNARTGLNPDSPYFMFAAASTNGTPQAFLYNSTYGSQLATVQSSRDGGIAHPSLFSGTKKGTFVTVGNAEVDALIGSFNSFVNSGSFDLLPMYVCIFDSNDHGILGISNALNFGFNMAAHSVTPNSSSAAFGQNTVASLKYIVPWSGSPPGTSTNRTGRDW